MKALKAVICGLVDWNIELTTHVDLYINNVVILAVIALYEA